MFLPPGESPAELRVDFPGGSLDKLLRLHGCVLFAGHITVGSDWTLFSTVLFCKMRIVNDVTGLMPEAFCVQKHLQTVKHYDVFTYCNFTKDHGVQGAYCFFLNVLLQHKKQYFSFSSSFSPI